MSAIGVKEKSSRKVVDLTSKLGTARSLTESRIHCDVAEKDIYLYYFTQMHPGRTLVFCNSIDCVRRLVNLFSLLRFVFFSAPAESNLIGSINFNCNFLIVIGNISGVDHWGCTHKCIRSNG